MAMIQGPKVDGQMTGPRDRVLYRGSPAQSQEHCSGGAEGGRDTARKQPGDGNRTILIDVDGNEGDSKG